MLEREARILDALDAAGRVEVAELSEQLGVSAVTIRKDLVGLERRRLLQRVRGGAVPIAGLVEGAFSDRMRDEARVKKALAVHAASLVEDGDVIAFDSSTTAHAIARELIDRRELVVVTQSLPTALLFLEQSSATIIVPGGMIRRESAGLVGVGDDTLVGKGSITKGFFGCTGLSVDRGLLDLALDESQSKRMVADACATIHCVFSSSKIDGFGYHSFSPTERVTSLVTDTGASDDFVSTWEAAGVPVARVEAPETTGPTAAPGAEARASIQRQEQS